MTNWFPNNTELPGQAGTRLYWSEMGSPIGPLLLAATGRGLCCLEFGSWADAGKQLAQWSARWTGMEEIVRDDAPVRPYRERLEAYFAGEKVSFDLPLDVYGTPFQRMVWQSLRRIPYGQTRSYKDIAADIGRPKAVRAVGGANNRNPLPIVIPCHRVIGAGGAMVGYGGGVGIKVRLLELERRAAGTPALHCAPGADVL
jgi:O-6-methylguanine DNA methyltransferase